MILKRLSAIAAVFFLLTAFLSPVYADSIPTSVDASTAKAAAEQPPYNVAATDINGDSLQYIPPPQELQITDNGKTYSYGYLAYGSPHDQNSDGSYRYIGFDYPGEDVPNLAFPPDRSPNGEDFGNEDWVYQPWSPTSPVPDVQSTKYDGDSQYIPEVLHGIGWLNTTTGLGGEGNGTGFNLSAADGSPIWNTYDGIPGGNIINYIHILMPPTTYTWGIGRMWHWLDGSLWYVTIPLAPPALSQSELVVTPSSATINVGDTQPFTATYYPDGQDAGNGTDVTTASNWSDDNTSVATIGANTGLATGVAQGSTNITASYTTPDGEVLNGTATLTVQAQQQPGGSQTGTSNNPPGGNNPPDGNNPTGQVSGALNFTAVGQAGTSMPAGTAEWTDMVTARLTSDAPPAPTASSPNYITGWTWNISNVTLNYPTQAQPGPNGTGGFSFGYPVDPPGQMENGLYVATTMTPVSMATQSSSTASASFREEWSMDGVGNGSGIYSIIKNPPGIMAATATAFEITATWTVKSNWTLMVYEGKNLDGNPIFSPEPESQNYTGACDGALTVDGSGVNSLGNNNNGN